MPADVSVSDIYDQTKAVGYIRYLSSRNKMGDVVGNSHFKEQENQNKEILQQSELESIDATDNNPMEPVVQYQYLQPQNISTTAVSPEKSVLHTVDIEETCCPKPNEQVNTLEENWYTFVRPLPDDTIQFGPLESTPNLCTSSLHSVQETDSLANISPIERTADEQLFHFHRSNIVPEMIENFKKDIIYTPMKVELVYGKGSDADGLSRQANTLFWNNFEEKNVKEKCIGFQ